MTISSLCEIRIMFKHLWIIDLDLISYTSAGQYLGLPARLHQERTWWRLFRLHLRLSESKWGSECPSSIPIPKSTKCKPYLERFLIWKSLEVECLTDIHITSKRTLLHGSWSFSAWSWDPTNLCMWPNHIYQLECKRILSFNMEHYFNQTEITK